MVLRDAPLMPPLGALQRSYASAKRQSDLYGRRSIARHDSLPEQLLLPSPSSSSYPHGRETHILSYPVLPSRDSAAPLCRRHATLYSGSLWLSAGDFIYYYIFAYRLHSRLAARQCTLGTLADCVGNISERAFAHRVADAGSLTSLLIAVIYTRMFITLYTYLYLIDR